MRLLFVCAMLIVPVLLNAQALNQQDATGRKQGLWKKTYEKSSQLRYEGQFKDNEPYGTFKYYQPDGKLSAIVEHRNQGVSYVKNYFDNGKVSSEGKYIRQAKDSAWSFYDESGTLLSKENYSQNLKEGPSYIYFPNGGVSIEENYQKGVLNGKRMTYYENKTPRTEATYVQGKLQGPARGFMTNGKLESEGSYVNDEKQGTWTEYNEDGSTKAHYKYKEGQLDTIIRLNGVFEEYFPSELLKAKYTYKDGKKNGMFTEYHDGGSWIMEERTDPRTGEKDTYRVAVNHYIKRKGTYLGDMLHGKVEIFDKKGIQEKTEQYANGKIQ